MKTCGKCVPIEEHRKLERQWNTMAWLCALLLALTAATGVIAMNWRSELSDTRQQLDRAADALAAKGLEEYREVRAKK